MSFRDKCLNSNLEDKLRVITRDISIGGGTSKALSNGRGDMVASDRCVLTKILACGSTSSRAQQYHIGALLDMGGQ